MGRKIAYSITDSIASQIGKLGTIFQIDGRLGSTAKPYLQVKTAPKLAFVPLPDRIQESEVKLALQAKL